MQTFNLDEAAAFLRIHPHTLEAKARAGEVPGAKVGKCWVFIDDDLADHIRSRYQGVDEREEKCHSTSAAISFGANGRSAAKELEKRLARPTGKRHRNITTAAAPTFGVKLN